jgi:hypothetical protein
MPESHRDLLVSVNHPLEKALLYYNISSVFRKPSSRRNGDRPAEIVTTGSAGILSVQRAGTETSVPFTRAGQDHLRQVKISAANPRDYGVPTQRDL